ncbi:CYTH and CHAD domain-containing protein [Propionivibrio dicarboxylicus]|uniref:Inorganic triphosphatase YgiF, contains CYTH and CHAD domains n=1 Tax=Propionivibrio dicarboxylicus TaxID=83767 RepID=A0A1G8G6J4_9RHOO|nr:CYTH and CHAD domain-containing protein [Propionivibrio dicarboxylicus]SDH89911.1 Inorganic triphosphatase YgiF, contains CYTH and CHAD domains [Propionivibrio dicarboxylicus]
MSREIELKLRLSPAQGRRLSLSPRLAGLVAEKKQLFNTYYDTPGLDLRARGIALRLRRQGANDWRMTVKGGDAGAGGLAQRREWEAPTAPGCFDFGIVGDPELRAFLEVRRADLLPVFTTDFSRTAWRLTSPEATVELALDRGWVQATTVSGERRDVRETICEVEIELLQGQSSDALFDLAIDLAAEFQLHPEIVSKAERGYALAAGAVAPPMRAAAVGIGREMAPVDAFRAVAAACLVHLQRNEAGAIAGQDPEYVHQARVAIRRLRSAFRIFEPVLSPDFVATYLPRWKRLGEQLGRARDWDVLLAETLAPLEAAFPGHTEVAFLREAAQARRVAADSSAAGALKRVEYSRLLLAFSAALLRQSGPTIGVSPASETVAKPRRFAADRLQRQWKKAVALARQREHASAERRHRLRIELKKLRYALDFFLPLLPRAELSRYQSLLSRLQETAGAYHDQVMARRLVAELRPDGTADSLVSGWLAGRMQLLAGLLDAEIKRFLNAAPPWR